MLHHATPFFDCPEKLEYPTETWAAQEFRKANVMRCASAYADEPMRSALRRRGAEFAERARLDLMRFETRDTAQAIALLLIEGTRDIYHKGRLLEPEGRPCREYEFGEPEVFLTQRRRVLTRWGIKGILSKIGVFGN